VRKRRKTKYTWLPTIGQDAGAEAGVPDDAGFSFASAVTEKGEDLVLSVLLVDEPFEGNDEASVSLADQIGSEYYIRRIVGKFHASYSQLGQNVGNQIIPDSCLVTAGFFIARADTSNLNEPIGAPTTPLENYSPRARQNIREPWIWRRTWMLGNNLADGLTIPPTGLVRGNCFFPATTAGYGSVLDGPHIDAKTSRRVRKEERLFFACSVFGGVTSGSVPDTPGLLQCHLDYRVLGALRKSVARGAF